MYSVHKLIVLRYFWHTLYVAFALAPSKNAPSSGRSSISSIVWDKERAEIPCFSLRCVCVLPALMSPAAASRTHWDGHFSS